MAKQLKKLSILLFSILPFGMLAQGVDMADQFRSSGKIYVVIVVIVIILLVLLLLLFRMDRNIRKLEEKINKN